MMQQMQKEQEEKGAAAEAVANAVKAVSAAADAAVLTSREITSHLNEFAVGAGISTVVGVAVTGYADSLNSATLATATAADAALVEARLLLRRLVAEEEEEEEAGPTTEKKKRKKMKYHHQQFLVDAPSSAGDTTTTTTTTKYDHCFYKAKKNQYSNNNMDVINDYGVPVAHPGISAADYALLHLQKLSGDLTRPGVASEVDFVRDVIQNAIDTIDGKYQPQRLAWAKDVEMEGLARRGAK